MAENTNNKVSAPRKGMNFDMHPVVSQQDMYTYCLNGAVETNSQDGNFFTIQNEGSNVYATVFPSGFQVIGRLPVPEQNRVIFFLVNPTTGSSIIGETLECQFDDNKDDIDSFSTCADCIFPEQKEQDPLETKVQTPYCPFHIIIQSDCLGFSIDYPVRSKYKITDCGLNIYYTDDLNQRRFTYFDYADGDQRGQLAIQEKFFEVTGYEDDDCAQPIYNDVLDCNKIKYHPSFEIPCIKKVDVITGGECKAGTYQVFIAYSDKDGTPMTEYFPATNPTPLFTKYLTVETDYKTDKGLRVEIDNLDQTFLYSHYTLVIAETINNFTEFKKLGVFPVSQSNVLYSGNEENLPRLTAEDIFFRKAYYHRAANITSANGYLFFSNLTENGKPNLQRAANKVKLYWQTVAIPEAVYSTPEYTARFRTYMRDELYAMGIEFINDDGEVLGTYHIPGPSREYFLDNYDINVDSPVNNNDVIEFEECEPRNCCDDSTENPLLKQATLHVVCPDNGCEQEAETQLVFSFPQATTESITLHIGQIIEVNLGTHPQLAVGTDLFDLPPGVTPWTYYDNPNAQGSETPFEVVIPAGVTSFTTSGPIAQIGQDLSNGAGRWICQSCQYLITDLYIKTANPLTYQYEFTNSQGIDFHLVVNGSELIDVEPDDCVDCSTPFWQVYNGGFIIDEPHEVIDKCEDDKIWEWGEFAFWESTRRYPNDPVMWGELCGKPIRHHKFPDSLVTHIHDGLDGEKLFKENNFVFPIGVRVDHQSVIDALDEVVAEGLVSQEARSRITSYRIVRGNRVGQKSVAAKGLIYDMWSYDKFDNKYYYPNYPYNDLRADNFIANTKSTYNGSNTSSPIPNVFSASGRYTFHSPDTHFQNEGIGNILKLETLEYGKSEGYFNYCEEQAKQRFLSTAAMTLAFAAGVAAAFSATGEKECVTYKLQADTKVDTSTTGDTPVGIVTGSSPGTIQTVIQNSGFSADSESRVEHNNPYDDPEFNFQAWSPTTGSTVGQPVQPVREIEKTTCKGTPYQLLSPLSGSVVGTFLQQAIYRGVLGMKEMQIIIDLIKALIPLKNMSVQYNSVGRYNNYKKVLNSAGVKIREIKVGEYLDPVIQTVDETVNTSEFTTTLLNNWHRERSVYLRIDENKKFPNPSVEDNSRNTLDQLGFEIEDLDRVFYRDISSYYASIKRWMPDQYGSVTDIEYLPTGQCPLQLGTVYGVSQTGVFGGDTFINRFALKRKHPFFLQTRFKMNDESDVKYSDLGNAGYPNYFFNTELPLMERLAGGGFADNILDLVEDLLGVAESRLDARTSKFFYQNGLIHLYSYGIPYFFTESDVNVDYRHAENTKELDFYPRQQDLKYWLQEKNVPLSEDNAYLYNRTYSKQNKEAFVSRQVREVLADCKITHPSSVIQSEEDLRDSRVDKWLIFKANNINHFPAKHGRIIGLDGVENDKVLVRFENGTQIFGAYATLNTDEGSVVVGNGGVFASRPQEFASTSLGFAGSQHMDIIQTEFGHVWADAKRGQIFNLAPGAKGLDELAKHGMRNWFKENLPFQILKDFPTMSLRDIDNNFKGLGLHFAFDKRFSRFFITKLDYKKTGTVTYDPVTKLFMSGDDEVSLGDSRYFCNKSWTLSYNFLTESWVSFHSFLPNYYVDNVEFIQSGLNAELSSLWSHNLTNKSYQVYYGELQPFTIETISSPMAYNGVLNSIDYVCDVIRYHNSYDAFHTTGVTFNKAMVYNDHQHSGQLEMHVRNENDMMQSISFPKTENNKISILVTNTNGIWNFNQFWDTVNSQAANLPFFKNKCSNAEKELNLAALNYFKPDVLKQKIRGRQNRIRLTNDLHSNYQFVYHLIQEDSKNG
jgi:hypothetical protein